MKNIFIAALILAFPFSASAATDYLLKLDGVKGETAPTPSPTTIERAATTDTDVAGTGLAVPTQPLRAGTDYLLEIEGIKGESKDDTKASADMFLEIEGIKGESKDDKTKSPVRPAVGDIDDGAEEPQPLMPDFSILFGGGDDDCDDGGKDGCPDDTRQAKGGEDCDDKDDTCAPDDAQKSGTEHAQDVFVTEMKSADATIESISFNYEKIQVKTSQSVKLFGVIPTVVSTIVEIDSAANVKVQLPWWAVFASGKDESVGDRIFSSVSNVLKTKHDTAKNSIGNIR